MKNTFRKAALSTICMLIVAVVSLTGVTYAWFTQGTQATVDQFNVGVEASAGNLMIAHANNGALAWGTSIKPFDETVTGTMTPVSGTIAGGTPVLYKANLAGNAVDFSSITAVNASANEGKINYLTFDFYVTNATGAQTMDIKLTNINGFTGASAQALRIAFVQYDTIATNSNPATADAFASATNVKSSLIFEPNSASHTDSGKADYVIAKGIDEDFYKKDVSENANVQYETHHLVSDTIATGSGANNSRFNGEALSDTAQNTFDDITTVIASFAPHTAGKISVYIWLEGQDHDCLNDVAATTMVLPIKLEAAFH